MTTLLQEFEAWLKDERKRVWKWDNYSEGIIAAQKKLEELKKKHQPKTLVQQFKDRAEFDPLEENVKAYLENVVIPELEKHVV